MKTPQRKKEGRQSAADKNANRNLSCGEKEANGARTKNYRDCQQSHKRSRRREQRGKVKF